jgi:hypothetical protein
MPPGWIRAFPPGLRRMNGDPAMEYRDGDEEAEKRLREKLNGHIETHDL